MLPGIELTNCTGLAVPHEVMHHVVRVESSFNPYAIGVVGGRLVRQPKTLPEAVATVRMLERRGYNFSIGVAQVNRYNLGKYGLDSYEKAFDVCPNLQAGSRILAECYSRSQDWGKSFSCYYSGNFVTGFRHGYVQKIYASMRKGQAATADAGAIAVIDNPAPGAARSAAASPGSAAYAPARRSGASRLGSVAVAPMREPDTAATQAAAAAAATGIAQAPAATMPMAVAQPMAPAMPQLQQPVTVSLARPAATGAAARPPAQPPSQGDQAFVF